MTDKDLKERIRQIKNDLTRLYIDMNIPTNKNRLKDEAEYNQLAELLHKLEISSERTFHK